MAFDPDSYLQKKKSPRVSFKDESVKNGFSKLDPGLRKVAETLPVPATVTSSYRSPQENAAVGGVSNSYHTQGKALDFRKGELTDQDRKHFADSGYEIISEDDHDHVEPIKGFVAPTPKSSFNPDAYLKSKQPIPEIKEIYKAPESPEVSPLSIGERAKIGWGNQQGISEYLKGKGKEADYQDGELKINGQAADPNNLRGWSELTAPGLMAGQAKDFYEALNSGKPIQEALASLGSGDALKGIYNRVASASNDLPSDLAELPSDALKYLTNFVGGTAGTAGGLLTGPLAPVLGPTGMIAGSAAGSFAGEKAKEAIGGPLGVYKTGGDYVTPESVNEAKTGALTALLPAAYMGGKMGMDALAKKAVENNVAQRIYATSTGTNKALGKDPKAIEILMKEGATPENLVERQAAISSEYPDYLGGKTATAEEIAEGLPGIPKKVRSLYSSTNEGLAGETAQDVVDKFSSKFVTQPTKEIVPGGTVSRPSYADFKSDFLEKYGSKKPASAYVSDPDPADLEDLLEYGMRPKKGAESGNVRILRSGNGVPVSQTPIYSETRTVGRKTPLGREVSWPEPVKEIYTPEKPNIIKEGSLTPNEEDIVRLYQQQYPDEFISLPGREVTKPAAPISLEGLNAEKIKQAKEAMRVFESEGQKGTAKQFSQKELSDYLRSFIEKKAPEVRPLNQRYHAYDVLDEGLQKMAEKEGQRKFSLFSPSSWAEGLLSPQQSKLMTKAGLGLFNRGTNPDILNQKILQALRMANQVSQQ